MREIPSAVLREVAPLLFTRVLLPLEAEQVWDTIERAWGLGRRQYWYPLTKSNHAQVEAFEAQYFLHAVTLERLRTILTERGITRVWELRE